MGTESGSTIRGHRLFAAAYDLVTSSGERRLLGPIRRRVVGAAIGRVIEIGAGTGANFPHYNRDLVRSLAAIEPDSFMLRRAEKRAKSLMLGVALRQGEAASLPFPDGSFDTVVATLVLCTVADPARALAEIRRVLAPGGRLRFIEHVRAPAGLAARVQDTLTPVWGRLAAGCQLNRRTVPAIEAAGFEIVEIETWRLRFTPLHTLVAGAARVVK